MSEAPVIPGLTYIRDLQGIKARGRGLILPPAVTQPAVLQRKEGANYVRYEDLYLSVDSDLQATLNRTTGNKVVTFPEGEFIIPPNFSKGYMDGIRFGNGGATNCNGISGSGKNTIFKMLSSNKPQIENSSFGANNYFLIQGNGENWPGGRRPNMEMSQFTLQGTVLGADHDHNGLRYDSCLNPLIEDVWINGIRGSDKIPPGETGSISLFRQTGGLINRVDVDGRRAGQPVSAAALMPNHTTGLIVRDSDFHHQKHGGGNIAWFHATGGRVYNSKLRYPGTGKLKLSGNCANHEQSDDIKYYGCSFIADRDGTGGGGTLHIAINSDSSRGGTDSMIEIYDPVWDALSIGGGKLFVDVWDLGDLQMQRSKPRVFKDGQPLDFFFNMPSKYGAPIIR